MRKEFKRKQVYPIMLMLPAIIFAVITALKFSIGDSLALLTMVTSIIFLVNAIWSFSTPAIRFDDNKIFFKEALFRQKEVLVSSIDKIEFHKDKIVKFYKEDGTVLKVRLDMLKKNDRNSFKHVLDDSTKQNSMAEQV